MKLVYTELPELKSRSPLYAEWKDLLDEFWMSGRPSAMIQGTYESNRAAGQIRTAVKKWYDGRIAVYVRNR